VLPRYLPVDVDRRLTQALVEHPRQRAGRGRAVAAPAAGCASGNCSTSSWTACTNCPATATSDHHPGPRLTSANSTAERLTGIGTRPHRHHALVTAGQAANSTLTSAHELRNSGLPSAPWRGRRSRRRSWPRAGRQPPR
jgi:hypothetical protein